MSQTFNWTILYGTQLSDALLAKASQIRALICDVDGVLTEGKLHISETGSVSRSFHAHDGYGLRALQQHNILPVFMSAAASQTAWHRAKMLGVVHVYTCCADKSKTLQDFCERTSIVPSMCAYIGDDWIDWPAMRCTGLRLAVPQAHPSILHRVDYVTTRSGGNGAVREVCDLLLYAQGKLPIEYFQPAGDEFT